MNREPKKIVSVRLTREQYEGLLRLAEEEARTPPGCLRALLSRRLREEKRQDTPAHNARMANRPAIALPSGEGG